jgi:diguanylate cyclase (GGDEF)-like protein
MALFMLDVDDFKKINDTLGHLYGNAILKVVSEILAEAFKDSGYVGRWGGDEFLVVCANEQEAEAFAENLAVSESRFNRRGEKPFRLSISCGIAGNDPQNGKTAEEIRKEADRKMYEQKKQRHRERSEKEDIINQTGV